MAVLLDLDVQWTVLFNFLLASATAASCLLVFFKLLPVMPTGLPCCFGLPHFYRIKLENNYAFCFAFFILGLHAKKFFNCWEVGGGLEIKVGMRNTGSRRQHWYTKDRQVCQT